jgi:hypothetical protein
MEGGRGENYDRNFAEFLKEGVEQGIPLRHLTILLSLSH